MPKAIDPRQLYLIRPPKPRVWKHSEVTAYVRRQMEGFKWRQRIRDEIRKRANLHQRKRRARAASA